MSTELATTRDDRYDGLVMVVSPAEAKRRIQELQAFVKAAMVPGVDFGVIPGTGTKPSLYQPGAQKLAELYGFAQSFVDVAAVEDWDKPFFIYRKKCLLTSRRDGRFISDGIGSCNSREDRYAWRWVFDNEVPREVDRKNLKSRTKTSKGGKPYTQFRMPNEDVYSIVNTIEKMACKRSLIHAVIGATRSSGLFTQDVEDLPREAFGDVEETRPWDMGKEEMVGEVVKVDVDAAATRFKDALGKCAIEGTERDARAIGAAIAKAGLPDTHRAVLREIYELTINSIRERDAQEVA